MKSIENIENIENKRVILRLDLNVPIKNGKITDTNRIDKVIPTLKFLLKKKAKIIIISHVGRPKGKIVKELSLELVSLYIKSKIKKETYTKNPTWSTSYITIENPTIKTNGKSNSIAQKADILPKLWCQKSCATRGKIAIESRMPTKGMTQKIDK